MKQTAESIASLPITEILPALAAHWKQATGEGMRYWRDSDPHFEICRDLRYIEAMEAEMAQRRAEITRNAQTLLARMEKKVEMEKEEAAGGKLQPIKWRAWNQGEAAHSRGSKLSDNPYRGENDYLAEQWASGWISADNPPPNSNNMHQQQHTPTKP